VFAINLSRISDFIRGRFIPCFFLFVYCLVLIIPLINNLGKQRFHLNEIELVENVVASYGAFLERDWDFEKWEEKKIFYAQPVVPAYITGFSLWIHHQLDILVDQDLNIMKSSENRSENVEILFNSIRLPMAIFTWLTCVLILAILSGQGENSAAFISSFMLAINPLVLRNCKRALPEAPLLFFMTLSILFIVLCFKSLGLDRKLHMCIFATFAGLSAGFAVGSKLLGLMVVAVFLSAVICNTVVFLLRFKGKNRISNLVNNMKHLAIMITCFILSCMFITYLLHPMFYRHPIKEFKSLVQYRSDKINQLQSSRTMPEVYNITPFSHSSHRHFVQKNSSLDSGVPLFSSQQRFKQVFFRAVCYYGTILGNTGIMIDSIFIFIGLMYLIRKTIFEIRTKNISESLILLCWFVIVYCGLSVWIPIDIDRYYLITIPILTVLSGIGIVFTVKIIWDQLSALIY